MSFIRPHPKKRTFRKHSNHIPDCALWKLVSEIGQKYVDSTMTLLEISLKTELNPYIFCLKLSTRLKTVTVEIRGSPFSSRCFIGMKRFLFKRKVICDVSA